MELEPLDFDPFPTTAATAAPKPAPTLEPIDFDPFPVAASQPEPQGWYESTAQTARDSISKSAVGRGFTAGLLQENPDNLGNAVEGFGYLSGSTWAVDQGKSIQDWAKTAGGVSKQGTGILDSDSLDSFLTNVGETFGSGVASTLPSVVAGVGGAAVGSVAGPVGTIGGGLVGAGSASYVQSFGELYGALKEAGVDPQRAAELSKYGAVPIASLDMIGLGGMAKPFIGEARREIVHGLARRIATEAAKGATTEGITEAAQEFLKDATVTYETGRPLFTAERAKGWAEAGIGGALVGGAVDAGAGFRRPEMRRDPNAPDPALPPPKPGDIESPIPTADIQRGRAMMDALIEGRMEEAMGLGRPGQAPAPAAPGPAPSAPTPEPVAPRGYEPLYDDEDPELQVGWINPRTGDVRGLNRGASNEGTAAAPEPVSAAEAAPPLERPAPGDQAAPVSEGLKTNSSSPSAPEDEFGQMLSGRPTAADVRRIGVTGAATGGMVAPITAPASPPAGDGSRAAPVKVEHPDHVEVAAARAQTAPSDGQKEAGNYQKGHLRLGGMDITIETPKDAERSGTAPDGTRWSVKMPAHYGYVKRSEGADGDQVDVYIGPEADTGRVFVFDQFDPKTRRFDEHKAVLGVRSIEDAQDLYDGGFSDGSGPRRRGGVTEMSTDEFRTWAMSGDTSKPLGEDLAAAPVAAPAATPETMDRVTGFRTAKGSTYTIDESGRTVRDKAARNDPGHEGDSGVKPVTARTVYLDVDASQLSAAGLTLNVPEKGARVAFRADGKAALLTWNPKANQWGKSSSWLDVRNEPAVGRYPLELWKPVDDVPGHEAYGRMHAGNKIVEIFSGNRQDGVVPPASVSTTPEPQKSATDRVPDAPADTTPTPAETKIERAKRRAREMVAEGKTTGDIQRTLRAEGASNVEVTAAMREAGKAQAKPPETTPEIAPKSENPPAAKPKNPKLVPVSKRTKEEPPRRTIGLNRFGQPVLEDERGVRSYVADGIRMTESVAIAPDGSVSINTGRRSESFKTKDEVDRETSGENARPLADRIADFKRDGRTWAEVLYELGYRGRSTDEQNEILRLWNRGKTGEAQARPQPKSPAKVREDALATGAPPVEDDRERQRQENIRALDERAMIPDGFELGAVRKLDKFDVSGTTRTVGDFKAIVRHVAPFGTFDGYGQTREEAIKDALRQAQSFRSTKETAQEPKEPAAPDPAPAPKPENPLRAVFDDELDAIFGKKEPEPAPAPAKPRTARAAAKSAAKNTAMGLDEIAKGLNALFGGDKLSSGLTFDEETYAKAKPMFIAGARKFAAAGQDIADVLRALVRALAKDHGLKREAIENMWPYMERFTDDVRSGTILLSQEADTDGRREDGRDLGQAREPEAGAGMAPGQPDGDGSARNLGEPSPEDAGAPQGAPGRRGSGSRSRTPRSGGQKGEPQTGDAPNGRLGDGGAGVAPDGAGDGGHPRTAKQPASTRPNYHVADPDSLIGGTPKVRFARNRAAIEAFQAISEEGRDPTQEELDAMAAYIGWGSFGQELFQGTWERPRPRDGWQNEDRWLREHLGRDQWESAQNSIINAHYTDPPTVKAMWDMVARMGFKGGRVLEPSMGIGNFFGMMPRDLMAKSDLTGIELDKLTGGMAKLLYPQANISIKGYQESRTPDGFYDLVIGNWPFAADGPADRRYNNLSPSLHDYFFLKALDQTRPGGLVVGITSAGTMDKAGRSVRIELARKAELVAAFRLPSGAFEKYAGTAVVTDIIVLKKREAPAAVTGETWVDASVVEMPGGEIRVNDYFLANPQNVLGRLGFGHGTTYGRAGMVVERPADFMERLVSLPERLPEGVYEARVRGKEPRFVSNNTTDRTGSIVVKDGALYQVQGERLALLEDVLKYRLKDAARTAAREDQLKRLVDLRRKYGALIDAEREGKDDTEALRTALRKAYEGFKAAHGTIRDSDGLALMAKAKDSYASAVEALERQDGTPAKILREPTVRSRKRPEKPSIRDAFVIVRNETRAPDIEQVAKLAGTTVEAVTEELLASKAIYRTPGDGFEVADVYLSGNVRRKLREAQAALEQGEDMQASIDALSKVMPKDIPYFQIEAKMGATWIDPQVYRDFIASLLGVGGIATTDVRYSGGYWKVRFSDRSLNRRPEAEATWGMREYAFDKLLNAAMNNLTVKIMTKDADGNDVVDTEANKEAAEKIMKIREEFTSWVWKDAERRVALEHSYNEVMNAVAIPQFDGSFLEFPGMALKRGDDPFSLRSHQVNAIWRGIANQRGLYAHEVGTGKTYTMAGIAVESRRYGLAKKPLLFAHNANSATVAREINDMYPGAAVLYVDNLSPDTVETTMRRIANEDWDVVVMPHSLIDRMSMKEETLMELAKEEIAALEQEAIEAAKEDGIRIGPDDMDDPDAMKKVRSPTAKDLVKQRNRIIEKIREWAMKSSRENSVAFEDLGVDMVIVDEAHEFKKPPIATRMRLRGLNTSTSNRSIALNFLTGYVKKMNGGKGVHVFTGTPITNTLTEIFNMMRFVMSDQMQLDGVANWDAWFNTFADSSSDVELTPTGEYEPITRLAAFVNVADLRRMAGQYMDTVFADDMPEFKPRATKSGKTLKDTLTPAERDEIENGRTEKPVGRPYKRIINDVGPMGEAQRATLETLIQRSRAFRAASPKERRTMLLQGDPRVPIRVESDAANAGLDPRLFDMEAADEETSKVNRAVRNLLSIYNSDKRATQVVFMEMGFSDTSTKSGGRDSEGNKLPSKKVARFNLAKDIVAKLVDGGVPRDEIAIVDGGTSKEKRREIADKMNASKIRIVIGNTDTLGVGVNMQVNLRAMHHLDAPWMPGELEQRNGRGHRQGNKWNTVLEYRYITEKLDGRRWQVLMVKDRFIKAFLKADDSVRVIEGDAVSTDEADADIAATLSEAAGDPRLLIMNKLSADIAKLENRERTHSFGVADAKSRARRVKEEIQSIKELLPAMRANAEHVAAIQKEGTFTATVGGTTYTDRKEAQEAIDTIVSNIAVGEKPVIAQIQGFEVRLDRWPVGYFANGQRQPVFKMQREGLDYDISTASVQSVAGVMRGLAKRVTDAEAQIVDKQASIGRLNEAADAPFAQQATLDKKQKMLADVRADLAANPVPPPPWLRVGAPVGTEVFVDGEKRVVEGHRWTADGYLVVTEAGDVDYLSVRDANGVRLYEARPFVAPEIIEKPPGAEAPGPERKRPQAAPRSGRPSADILSRIDGMEFSEASPAGWGEVEAMPVPKLSAAEVDEVAAIIQRVAGLDGVRVADTIPIPANSPGAKAWGRTEAGRASAFYSGVSDTVTIALDMPEGAGRRVAYHEAFHRLQRLYLTTKELAVLLAEGDRLRAIIAASIERGRAVANRMAQSEVEAEAFSLYTVAKERGGQAVTGFPLRVRMAFAKIDRIVRAVRNWLNGRGYQTYEDVFERAAEGRTALRTARGITGTTVMDDFSMIDDTDTEEDTDLDFGAARRSMGQALFARNATLLQRVRAATNWDAVSETMDRWRYAVQDIVIDLKQVQREIVEVLGPLAESQNPYLAYELSESRAGPRLEALYEDMVLPMLARMKAAGISIEDLGEYLYAKHAPERNARIAEINPKIPEGGSGMTDEEAASIVDRVESGPKARDYARLASLVYEINDFALQIRLEAGLLSEEQADAWRQSYEFYVPLRGFAEMDPEAFEDRPNLGGSGVNVRGKESQRALGRESRAADIVAHAIMQAQEAIARAERNKVGQALYELARAAPNREFWRADPVKTKAVWNKKLQQVVYQRVHALSRTEEDHTVFLKIDGQEHRVSFNMQNPRARRLAEGMRRLKGKDWGALVRTFGAVNRFLSTVNTTLSPEFIITNAFKDLQTAMVNIGQYDVEGIRKRTLKHWASVWKGLARLKSPQQRDEWRPWYEEFIAEGGRTYWNDVESVQEIAHRLEAEINPSTGLGARSWRGIKSVFNVIEAANNNVENAIRLAAFRAAREAGMSPAAAASLAKNLTVNFNRRGAYGPLINAFYLFFNAGIQGSFAILGAMRSPAVRKAVGAIIVSGAIVTLFNSLAGDDDEDGESFYNKIPDEVRQKNMIIMIPGTGGRYAKIAMPWGYNAFYSLGRVSMEAAFGRKPLDAAADAMVGFLDAFNPIGGAQNLLKIVSPTIIDPIVELYANRDFADRPIAPDKKAFGAEVPNAQRYWNSVSPLWRLVTDSLTTASGGDRVRPGAIDLSPEWLEYLFGVATGSAGQFVSRTVGLVGKMADPTSDWSVNDVPFARRVLGGKAPWVDKAAFYERLHDVEQQKAYLKGYVGAGDAEGRDAVVAESRDKLGLEKAAHASQKAMADIRRARDAVWKQKDRGQIDDAAYRERIQALKDREQEIVTRFNRIWLERIENAKPAQ